MSPPQKRRGFGARAVGSYVPALTQKAFEAYGFALASLITDWRAIVGAELAAHTAPERLKWARGPRDTVPDPDGGRVQGAVLHLRVDPARALDVQYRTRMIIERINAYFGYAAVDQVRLIQAVVPQPIAGPARAPPPAKTVDLPTVADDGLRGALERLASAVAQRK
jgi:hypothetical protein